jgi:hypothetical protein
MARIKLAVAAFALLASLPPAARAEPAPAAFIIGNATYGGLPVLPGCGKSANRVMAAARAAGFQVTERQDASTGGIDAGIAEFSQHLAGPGNGGLVYVCGYGTDFNDRIFLLPITARIERPSDVLTQGVLAKSLLATVSHDPATVGIVVFDLFAKPDGPRKLGLDALTGIAVPDAVGIVAAAEATPTDAPTPLATALAAALKGPRIATGDLLADLRTRLAGNAEVSIAIHEPARPGLLASPAAAPPPPVAAPPVAAPPGAAPPGAAPVAATTPPPAVTPDLQAADQLPDEARMTEVERRKVQGALIRLGYYDTSVDGVFGPETRAAIRRYQHEIGGETTGRLTADQATRLVNSR